MFGLDRLDAEAAYLRLPVVLQNIGCSLVGWRTERTRYAGAYPRILADAVARTYWSAEETTAFRDRRLTAAVQEWARSSPFCRERFRAAGVSPGDVRSIDDLALIPVLTKHEVQEHAAELFSAGTERKDARVVHTSGTTGGALRFPVPMSATQEQWAVWWRYRGWHGIGRETWSALFAGRSIAPSSQRRPPFWRVNQPGRQLLFSGYHMSPENLPAYVGELRRRKPPWLHGYPSLLAVLAGYLVDAGVDLGYGVKWVTIGAENLLPHQSDLIERAFGAKPIQHYGLAEGVANISECELGSLHVDEDFATVEFIPLGRDDLYRIVGTNVTNGASPLLRYDTQDLATIRPESSCACGRPGRVVDRVDGRLEDYVVLTNGARIGRMDHIFKDMVHIREAQIRQARAGEMTIRVVRGHGYRDDDEHALLREAAKRVGADMEIRVEYVDSLPRSPTGKLRFVLSDVAGASIDSGSER